MKRIAVIIVGIMVAMPAWAKPAPELVTGITDIFKPSEPQRGLVSAQEKIDTNKLHGYAVIRKSGIPAGQAYWFITNQDYDYRPLIVQNGRGKTYFGKVDAYLGTGTIMIISKVEVFGKTVAIKLLSTDVIREKEDKPSSRDSRAAVALTLKFPKLAMVASDLSEILAVIQEYIEPADSLVQAQQLAARMDGAPVPKPVVATKAAPAAKPVEVPVAAVAPKSELKLEPKVAPKTETTAPVSAPNSPDGIVHAGMNFDQVKKIMGAPKNTQTRGDKVIFDYGDREVIFHNSTVYDLRWK